MTQATGTQITEKYVTLTHGKTRYFEAGSGEPLILIHGAGIFSGADTFLHLMPTLAERLRVISIDCLNWGPGDVFDQEFSFGYLVDHIREFMDALDIKRTNIAGQSMGGWIVTLLAYESPERLERVVFSAAGGMATRPLESMVEWKPPTVEQVQTQIGRRIESFPAGVDGQKILNDYLSFTQDPLHQSGFGKVMRHMTDPMTRQRYNTVRRLPHITTPSLILWGTADKTNDISMGYDMHKLVQGSQMITFEGAGHGIPGERPEEWAKAVLDFCTT
jgi:pimeloyl-ACP methyl ester carboxylesterase